MASLNLARKYNTYIVNIKVFDGIMYVQTEKKLQQFSKNADKKIKEYDIQSSTFIISDDILYCGTLKYNIEIWNLKTNTKLHTFDKHIGKINSLILDKKNNILYSSSCDKSVKKWCLTTFKYIDSINTTYRVYDINLYNDKLYIAQEHYSILVYDTSTFKYCYNYDVSLNTIKNIYLYDGKLYGITSAYMFCWDINTHKLLYKLDITLYKCGQYKKYFIYKNILYICGSEYSNFQYKIIIKTFNFNNNKFIKYLELPLTKVLLYRGFDVTSLCVHNDKIYTGHYSKTFVIWDMNTYFKPTFSCFNSLELYNQDIIKTILCIKERFDTYEYGLPPELWFYILKYYKITSDTILD